MVQNGFPSFKELLYSCLNQHPKQIVADVHFVPQEEKNYTRKIKCHKCAVAYSHAYKSGTNWCSIDAKKPAVQCLSQNKGQRKVASFQSNLLKRSISYLITYTQGIAVPVTQMETNLRWQSEVFICTQNSPPSQESSYPLQQDGSSPGLSGPFWQLSKAWLQPPEPTTSSCFGRFFLSPCHTIPMSPLEKEKLERYSKEI